MRSDVNGKTYWVVGASEGLGAELARQLDGLGATLVISARSAQKLGALAKELSDATPIAMDVTDNASVTNAIETAGDVDGVIYCVGQYTPMKTKDWDLETSLGVIDANYLGAVRLFAGVAPALFKRRTGHIVVIGSLAGFHGLPGAIGYSSSKGALMQLCENMFMDAYGPALFARCMGTASGPRFLNRLHCFLPLAAYCQRNSTVGSFFKFKKFSEKADLADIQRDFMFATKRNDADGFDRF
jgi:NADP-dependent 3-hydroxy acid dehydrogenase YdfG